MATVTQKRIKQIQAGITAPMGNCYKYPFHFETNSSGVIVNSDQTTAVVSGDVVRLGILPAGLLLLDAQFIISDASTASVTADFGFLYCDGVDAAAPSAQDQDYFKAALAMDGTGITRKVNVVAPLLLAKDAYLVMTVGGANHASASVVDVIVEGIWKGSPSAIPS